MPYSSIARNFSPRVNHTIHTALLAGHRFAIPGAGAAQPVAAVTEQINRDGGVAAPAEVWQSPAETRHSPPGTRLSPRETRQSPPQTTQPQLTAPHRSSAHQIGSSPSAACGHRLRLSFSCIGEACDFFLTAPSINWCPGEHLLTPRPLRFGNRQMTVTNAFGCPGLLDARSLGCQSFSLNPCRCAIQVQPGGYRCEHPFPNRCDTATTTTTEPNQ